MSGPALGDTVSEIPLAFRPGTAHEPGDSVQDERAPVWDEDALIRNAQAGDSWAFERIYELYVRRMYALSLRMVSNHQTAEDLTQEVFVKAFFALKGFEGRSRFKSWVQSIKVNHCLNFLRKSKGKTFVDVSDEAVESAEALHVAPTAQRAAQAADRDPTRG